LGERACAKNTGHPFVSRMVMMFTVSQTKLHKLPRRAANYIRTPCCVLGDRVVASCDRSRLVFALVEQPCWELKTNGNCIHNPLVVSDGRRVDVYHDSTP